MAMNDSQLKSPLSLVFLLHCAIDGPVAFQGLMNAAAFPFLEATNTTLVIIKMYSALIAATCVVSLLVYPLPEYLPGKRALALGFMIYHTLTAGSLVQAPRFIPKSFGPLMEGLYLSPENLWALAHALCGLGFALWWQGTIVYTQVVKQVVQGGRPA